MDAEAQAIYRQHTGRDDMPSQQFREVYAIVGRRGGKSIIAALVAAFLASFRDYSDVLGPGETGVVMLLAADQKQAKVLLGHIKALFKIPALKRLVVGGTADSITLTGRISIEVHASSFRTILRGFTIITAICDELAFWRSDESANPDVEILKALRPAMVMIPNALLLSISSPYAKRGSLWDAHRKYFGKTNAPVLVWQAETRSMNPSVPQREIDREFEQDAASARAEYGAQFRDDVATFIDREMVELRVVPGRFELPPAGDVSYVGFVDPSGGSSDAMTLAIAHNRNGMAVLDCLREVKPRFSPEQVVGEFAETLKSYRVHQVIGDAYSGEWVREQFRNRDIPYRISERNRSQLYLELLPMLNSGTCELVDNRKLILQLSTLERRTARSGNDSIDHAPGSHDDVANAAAGALVEAAGNEKHYAVIEYYKEEIARIEQPKIAAQPVAGVCASCGSSCVVKRGPILHCNSCGQEERSPVVAEVGPPPRAGAHRGNKSWPKLSMTGSRLRSRASRRVSLFGKRPDERK